MDSDFVSPEVQETPVKQSNKKWFFIGIGVFLLLSCLCVFGIAMAFTSFAETVATETTNVLGEEFESDEAGEIDPVIVDEEADEPEAAEEVLDPNAMKPGTYKVGTDLQPGIYTGEGSCYWERLKDLSGSFDAIIANDNTDGPFYVEIKAEDFAFSIDCPMIALEKVPTPTGELSQSVPAGMFLIGRDIKPGIYKGAMEGCYWERLSDVSGDFEAIVANDNSIGQYYVEIKDTDFAFSSDCGMTSIDAIPALAELPTSVPAGMYLIGKDIKPGTYKGEGECYWERLSDVTGTFDAIIDNDNTDGQFYIEVAESDYALSTDCEIELAE